MVRSAIKPPKKVQKHNKASQLKFPDKPGGTKQTDIRSFFAKTVDSEQTITHSQSDTDLAIEEHPRPTISVSRVQQNRTLAVGCNNRKCRYCPLLDTSGKITCKVTGEQFYTMRNITCRSSNLIYAITCNTCGKQYVGQTKRTLMARFQGHFNNVKRATQTDAIGHHFSLPTHKGTRDFTISVLTFISTPPSSPRALDHRLKCEKKWIHKLRCPAPQGLNIFD